MGAQVFDAIILWVKKLKSLGTTAPKSLTFPIVYFRCNISRLYGNFFVVCAAFLTFEVIPRQTLPAERDKPERHHSDKTSRDETLSDKSIKFKYE